MATNTQETKSAAIKIMEAVKSICPQLAEVSKQTSFAITITGDNKGIGMTFTLDWDPTADPTDRKPIEAEDIEESDLLRIDEGEEVLIRRALDAAKGNKREAAAMLGLSERTFYRKIKEYGITL